MRTALFWYMIVSPFVEFPILLGSHQAEPSEWARLPSAEALLLRRLRRNLFGVLPEQDLEGNRNPQGHTVEAEERAAAGRRIGPEAVTEQKTGYGAEDTRRNTALISLLADEVCRQRCSSHWPWTCHRRRRIVDRMVLCDRWKCPQPRLEGHVGCSSRIGSLIRHLEASLIRVVSSS
jgi:hypothetical protein